MGWFLCGWKPRTHAPTRAKEERKEKVLSTSGTRQKSTTSIVKVKCTSAWLFVSALFTTENSMAARNKMVILTFFKWMWQACTHLITWAHSAPCCYLHFHCGTSLQGPLEGLASAPGRKRRSALCRLYCFCNSLQTPHSLEIWPLPSSSVSHFLKNLSTSSLTSSPTILSHLLMFSKLFPPTDDDAHHLPVADLKEVLMVEVSTGLLDSYLDLSF